MRIGPRVLMTLPLALFLASALIGAWLSYNPSVGWVRFWLIASGIVLYLIFANTPERIRVSESRDWELLRYTLALLPLAVLIYFVLTNDWTVRLGKVAWLDPVLQWFATWQLRLADGRLDSNSLGGVLAALMPLQIAALVHNRNTRQIAIGAVLVCVSVLGLFLSESRGAWVALGVVAWFVAIWELVGQSTAGWTSHHKRTLWFGLVALTTLALGIAFTTTSLGAALLNVRSDRWYVWRNSLDLVGDYLFTGLGLGGFEMAYSSYVLLVHVPHTLHAHNLFLDIWLEQGLLGLVAFAGLIVAGVLNTRDSRWRIAALASLGVIVLHGFLDDAFYGYGGIAIPLLFVSLGVLLRQANLALPQQSTNWFVPILAGAMVVAVGIACVLPVSRAAWFANLGALLQTRAELSVYHWPEWGIQDDLRRSPQIDLAPAIAQYRTALAANPANLTANRRLGQIELSRGEYDSARRHLETAYAGAPEQRATRQMLGESYAIAGEFEKTIALWKTIDVSENQLALRQWWYDHIGERERAARLQTAIVNSSQ